MQKWVVWVVVLLVLVTVVVGCSSPAKTEEVTASSSNPTPISKEQKVKAQGDPQGILLIDAESIDRSAKPPKHGDQAPDFVFLTEDGKEYRLSDFRGRPVVLNFWATWCPPCRAEMPALDKAYQERKKDGLLILAINEKEDRDAVRKFRQDMGVSLPMLLDTRGLVGRTYLVQGLPTSFFIEPDGTVAIRWTGMLQPEDLEYNLEVLLGR